MLSDILNDIDCDMGSEWENTAYKTLYDTISNAFKLYFEKYRKSEIVTIRDLYGVNQRFYFN